MDCILLNLMLSVFFSMSMMLARRNRSIVFWFLICFLLFVAKYYKVLRSSATMRNQQGCIGGVMVVVGGCSSLAVVNRTVFPVNRFS